MSKLRISFVGLGNAGRFYFNILNGPDYISMVSFSIAIDADESSIERWEHETGIKASLDISDINIDNTDLAIVTSPSGSHSSDAKTLLSNGVNVLCEKPISLKTDEVLENISIASDLNVEYGSVFQNRYNSPIKFAKNIIQNNELGKIVSSSVQLQWCRFQDYYEDDWHGTWKSDGGVINQQGIHHIDALFYLLGDPESLVGFEGNISNKLEAEDTFVAAGTLHEGGFFTLEATTAIRPNDLKASIEIIGTKGQIGIGGTALNELIFYRKDGVDLPTETLNKYSEEVSSGFGNGHKKLLDEILLTWKDQHKLCLPLSASDALRSLQIVHALYSSVEQSRIVRFSEMNSSSRLGN